MRWIWWHHSPTSAVGVSSVSERVLTGVLEEDILRFAGGVFEYFESAIFRCVEYLKAD
jgi:hypothetical protein